MADPRDQAALTDAMARAQAAFELYEADPGAPASLDAFAVSLQGLVVAAAGLDDVVRITTTSGRVVDELRAGRISANPGTTRSLSESLAISSEALDQGGDCAIPTCGFVVALLEGLLAAEDDDSAPGTTAAAAPASFLLPVERWMALVTLEDVTLFDSFTAECQENLSTLERALLSLEKTPDDLDLYREAFRPVHNLKGTGGFIGLEALSALCHQAESLLDLGRSGRLILSAQQLDLLFGLLDAIRDTSRNLALAVARRRGRPIADAEFTEFDTEGLRERLRLATEEGTSLAQVHSATELSSSGPGMAMQRASEDLLVSSRFVRVEARNLDELLDSIGELVIAHSVVEHSPLIAGDRDQRRAVEEVTRIVGRLQDHILSLRLLPVRHTFVRMERLVRDLARTTGKKVNLTIQGEETEVDKTILEQIYDPLIHLLRNAVDHGIESPEERRAAGKPAVGQVRLQARHEAGFLVVEVDDDGRGIDVGRLEEKAGELGLPADELDERSLLQLIFRGGFSTARVAGALSGRGVGLDVVWQRTRELGGRVGVIAHGPMGGASFSIRMPLTTAIIDGLVVRVGGERYILPTSGVVVTTQIEPGDTSPLAGAGTVFEVLGQTVPLIRLAELFEVPSLQDEGREETAVVVGDATRLSGLLVDEVLGRQQVVVKSLPGVRRTLGVSAGAILGDGGVALILDIPGLLEAGGQWRPLVGAETR